MNDKSLSAQLGDHLNARQEYDLMKQVDREATAVAHADELTWLRELERAVRDIRATDKYSEQMLCVGEVQSRINQRIIELLEEVQERSQCGVMVGGPSGHYCTVPNSVASVMISEGHKGGHE